MVFEDPKSQNPSILKIGHFFNFLKIFDSGSAPRMILSTSLHFPPPRLEAEQAATTASRGRESGA